MSWANYDDIKAQLIGAGLILSDLLRTDARIQRWQVEGEDAEKRGWTKLREWQSPADGQTYIVGCYGIWRGNEDGYTKLELRKENALPLSAEEKAAQREAQKEQERKLAQVRKAEAKRAAAWAESVWNKSPRCTVHPYLTAKQIQPHSVRSVPADVAEIVLADIDESNFYRLKSAAGALIVPLHNANGDVQGLQFVYEKDHPRRAKIKSGYLAIRYGDGWHVRLDRGGCRRNGTLLIAEGYATAASLREATGQNVAYAFSANNLIKAGKELAAKYPQLKLLFCADDDYLTDGNPGCQEAAKACAALENSSWIKPEFPKNSDGTDAQNGKKLTDFNDLLVITGTPLVLANQVNAKLDELQWRDAVPVAGLPQQGGGGSDAPRKAAVSVMTLDDAVARFIPIDDGSGEVLFDTWTCKMVKTKQMISLLQAGVRWDDVKRHFQWVERGAYYLDQVGFDPAGNDESVKLNTWRGWPLKPKHGRCDLLLELLQYLCNLEENSEELYQWLLCWMAYPLQNPGAKMSSAVIMHGPQGTGKSTVFQTLARIYGDYATVLNLRGLEDKFNADWVDAKLFILAEEVVTRVEMWHIKNELKELVTGDWVRVNGKFAGAYCQRNHINFAFLSNEGQPLPLENDDRRHCVIWTPPELDQEFYDSVRAEIDNGGVAAFYDFLMRVDCSNFHAKKRPPETQAKRNLIDLSRPSEERFLIDWIAGDICFSEERGALPFCACGTTDLYSAYLKWCRQQGEFRPRALNIFIGSLTRRTGWSAQHRDRFDNDAMPVKKKRQRMIEPPASDVEKHLKNTNTDHRQQSNETALAWATRCFFAFRRALGGSDD